MELNGQPTASGNDSASALYTGESGRVYHEGKRALSADALPWVMALRAQKFQRYVKPADTVFELGVGAGWNLGKLQCARRSGCDAATFLSPQLTALEIEFVSGLRAMPDDLADVVICHQTLEHLLDPAEALRQLRRVMKPGGTLILHVPWERERRYARYRSDEPNHHLFNWNAQNLGNLVSVLAFRIESLVVRKYGYDRFSANLALRLHLGDSGFRCLRACLVALRPFREVELIARRVEKRA
jgi:SAM-dependent methyltransferase